MNKTASFILGSIFGAACGVVAGVMMAPRPGAESRAMAADAVNDVWDSAIDTYERGARVVEDKVNDLRPSVDAKTDELRAKVDLARERMDQLRDSLSSTVAATSSQVSEAVNAVTDRVANMAGEAAASNETPAAAVHVEVTDGSEEAAAEDKPAEKTEE